MSDESAPITRCGAQASAGPTVGAVSQNAHAADRTFSDILGHLATSPAQLVEGLGARAELGSFGNFFLARRRPRTPLRYADSPRRKAGVVCGERNRPNWTKPLPSGRG